MNDLSKLPKWAQSEINFLQRENARLTRLAESFSEEKDRDDILVPGTVFWSERGLRGGYHIMPRHSEVGVVIESSDGRPTPITLWMYHKHLHRAVVDSYTESLALFPTGGMNRIELEARR